MDWQSVELLGYAYFSEKGYRILVPVVRYDGYDFVAEKNGEFIRVNVKMAGLKDRTRSNSWSISQAGGSGAGYHENHQVDVYLTWLPHKEKFVELDGDFLLGGNSKSKRIPLELTK